MMISYILVEVHLWLLRWFEIDMMCGTGRSFELNDTGKQSSYLLRKIDKQMNGVVGHVGFEPTTSTLST